MKYKLLLLLSSLSLAVSVLNSSESLAAATNASPNTSPNASSKTSPNTSPSPDKKSKISTPEQTAIQEKNMNSAELNLKEGNLFLEENKKKSGITTLPSGLQYKIEKEGKGNPPGPTDFVTVHYRGVLPNGTEFDSSYSRHEPTTFAVNAVIPGWTEALQLMKPGAKWKIFVPPQLAYGDRAIGRQIGPNSTLIFDIELISVKPSFDENQDGNVDEWEDLD